MPIQTENGFYATGRRKESTARVWVKEGNGTIVVNGRPLDEYFGRETSKMILNQPLQILEQVGKVDVTVNVVGGGLSGQAGAIRHGLSRALCLLNPEFRTALKKAGFLTRDARVVERKKYGQPGARRRFQFSKRVDQRASLSACRPAPAQPGLARPGARLQGAWNSTRSCRSRCAVARATSTSRPVCPRCSGSTARWSR